MKIKIENFGPIHSFEMDLEKDMHILYGENNIGKSYAMTLIYILLKRLENSFDFESIEDDSEWMLLFDSHSDLIRSTPTPKESLVEITSELKKLAQSHFEKLLVPRLNKVLGISFDSNIPWQNKLNDQESLVNLSSSSLEVVLLLSSNNTFQLKSLVIKKRYWVSLSENRSTLTSQDALIWFYERRSGVIEVNGDDTPLLELKGFFQLYFLPSSRSGLYNSMSSYGPIFASLATYRHLTNEKFEIPTFSEPVSDYFLQLSSISEEKGDSAVKSISSQLEKDIIKGEISFNFATKKLEYFNQQANIKLRLEHASSMVSEVASIVAFLKYIIEDYKTSSQDSILNPRIRKKALLFIEEPEAHLHPQSQIKLFELFAQLSRLGIKVIMTTHSNYIFNKASNMILKGELTEDSVANYHIVMTEKGSIVNPKDTLHDWGMEDENFVGVAEELYRERLEASEENQ